MSPVPVFLARRSWWLALLLGWGLVVAGSLRWQLQDLHRQSLAVAAEGARNMFRMIVLTRAWNSEHGGVYVPVGPGLQPNPYLDHPRRDLLTTDGQALTLVNPAYMTRLLADMAATRGGSVFRITSLKPVRPKNAPDDWERQSLQAFDRGEKEAMQVVTAADGQGLLRYMAPLYVDKSCLNCHERQGYRIGDVRGGISVSQPYGPIEAASRPGRLQAYWIHGGVFLLVAAAGGWLLELLRRRWQNLSDNITALETTRNELVQANLSLGHARDAAEAASRAKSTFLATMSHELRTPLNAVVGFTHLLAMDDPEPRHKEMLQHIDVASQQLLGLIEQVLDLSHLESGEMGLVITDFDLDGLLARAHSTLEEAARAKGLACRLVRDPLLPGRLQGDPRRIAQVLGHFTANAVKFSEAGEITVRATRIGGSGDRVGLRLEVADQGIGIPVELKDRLFQAFEQADMSRTRRFGGAGLGLAICRHLAELMGGRVGVESHPGQGSRFWIELDLPAGRGGGHVPAAAAPRDPAGNGPPPAAALQDVIDRLEDLLAADDMAAATLWQSHGAALRPLLGDQAAAVAGEIAAFRFDRALKILRKVVPRA